MVWDPALQEPRPFRVLGGYSNMPGAKGERENNKGKAIVTLNKAAILAEIERLGTDLISGIVEQA